MTDASIDVEPHHDRPARFVRPMERDVSHAPPESVGGIIALLSAPGAADLDAVVVALQSLNVTPDILGDAVHADGAQYVRTLLYRDDRAEMLVLTWKPGQRSPVHDHGESTCIVRVVDGVATEHLYRRRERGASRREYMSRQLTPGVVTRTPGDHRHTLGNSAKRGGDVLVTLHVYSPPLKRG